ncbi:endo-1,4-beta-xylanase [Saccharicrinis aurantiacus]|uniref:endo-1,4-beta-xylanase n=1 Tax=Saccharicrinis aurantiacus TaxID=1849719 RepID=UPI00249328E6|nr:endo-1,4-beta-xylanase [Saccharicrinis aurantiacus]
MNTIKHISLALIAACSFTACDQNTENTKKFRELSLAKAYESKFLIGTALNSEQIEGSDTSALKVVKTQFNSIVAENCMKPEVVQPNQGKFDFALADKLVQLAADNNAFMVGHTLVWHSQTSDWMFHDADGKLTTRDTLIQRMKTHIQTVVSRYKGKVKGWDVVNEAVLDEGGLRKSLWHQIVGPDFIELAFQFAHEADPNAELYYNDYNMYLPAKRAEVVKLVKRLQEKGIRIDAVGMQAHYGLGADYFEEIENSINTFASLGIKVMVTELDVSVLPFPSEELTADVSTSYANKPEYNPYINGLPDDLETELGDYYAKLFKIYNRHSDHISRITFWGVNDAQTWRNYWPINGRTDYPLLFNRENEPKPAYAAVMRLAY